MMIMRRMTPNRANMQHSVNELEGYGLYPVHSCWDPEEVARRLHQRTKRLGEYSIDTAEMERRK